MPDPNAAAVPAPTPAPIASAAPSGKSIPSTLAPLENLIPLSGSACFVFGEPPLLPLPLLPPPISDFAPLARYEPTAAPPINPPKVAPALLNPKKLLNIFSAGNMNPKAAII